MPADQPQVEQELLPVTQEDRRNLPHHEQMADAEAQCVPCRLCGGKAVITDAGVGAGYYVACENGSTFRASEGCLINERRLGGWAYNVMEWWNRLHRLSSRLPDGRGDVERVAFQKRVDTWMDACFGEAIKVDRLERCDRFIEEALELVQTEPTFTADRAHALVDYVFGRAVGETAQEVGGVKVTLAALCNTFGIDVDQAAETELARVWTKVDAIRAKQATKPTGSALPIAALHPADSGDEVGRVEILWPKIRAYVTPPPFHHDEEGWRTIARMVLAALALTRPEVEGVGG